MDQDGVRQLLATRGVHTPAEVEQLVESWRAARDVLEQTPPWADTEQVEVIDPPAELSAMIADRSKCDALRATVQNLPHRIAFVSLGQLVAFQFTVDNLTFGSPYVQVAEFQGRLIVRNGYHRLVGLLSQGVTHAPVILVHCTDYAETGGVGPFFFPSQVVMGVKPPLLKHYLTPYAVEFDAADVHKTIRLRPDEFQVAVPE